MQKNRSHQRENSDGVMNFMMCFLYFLVINAQRDLEIKGVENWQIKAAKSCGDKSQFSLRKTFGWPFR